MSKLAAKKVLITGGTRGIGRALADELVARGAEVMVCGRSPGGVARVRDDLGVRALVCDVRTDVESLAAAVRAELAGLDVLINNAGIQIDHDVLAGIDATALRDELTINLEAPIALTARLLPLLLAADRPVIANVTSALAIAPSPRSPVYAATKAALATWTHALRQQLRDQARVVEIVPPLVATDMTAGRHDGAASAAEVAAAIARGLEGSRERLVLGKARWLAAIARLSPGLARRIMASR